MKRLFSIAAVVTFLLGLGWLFAPEIMLMRWDLVPDPSSTYMGRRYGVIFLGLAIILWMSRKSSPSPALKAILAGAAAVATALTVLTVMGLLNGTLGPFAWISAAAEVFLSAGFLYHLRRVAAAAG